jgi:3',5'-cyclic AMP phosphodiesterase CpdA
MRIALIADTHLSPEAPHALAHWQAAARVVERAAPALTLHLGDLTRDGEQQLNDIVFAAGQLEDWPTPLLVVPGNHDVGSGCGQQPLNAAARRRYQRWIGSPWWVRRLDGWRLIGLDAQLLGSGSEEEAAQWQWLQQQAAQLRRDERVALCLHRPLRAQEARAPAHRYVPAAAAYALQQALGAALRLVISGHAHQALDCTVDGVRHLWVPSTAYVFADEQQPCIGRKQVGLGLLTLDGDDVAYELPPAPALRTVCLAEVLQAEAC